MPTSSLASDVRCARCGCATDPSAASCAACGLAIASVLTSAGAVGERRYQPGPAPEAHYDIPLGATDSLGAAFTLWTTNIVRLAVLGFVPYALLIPLTAGGVFLALAPDVVQGLGSWGADDGLDTWWPVLAAGGVAFGALFMVLTFASMAACMHVVNEKTQGVDVTAGTALLSSLKHVGWVFVAYLGLMLVAMAGVAAPIAPLIWGMSEDSYALAALAMPMLAVTAGAVVVCARLLPLVPVIVVEDTDAFTAIGRAWRLTSGRTMKVVPAVLLFGLVYMGLTMAVGIIGIVPIIGAFIQMGVNAILVPLCYVFAFAVYAGCVREERDADRSRA